ncbi:MAG: methyltransferase domain-containing protein [archaeon]
MKGHIPFEAIGSIAILQLPDERKKQALGMARKILASNKHLTTVLLKSGRVKGRLRKRKLDFILGNNTKETLHRESGCLMKLNVETCYFSPRLSNERQIISSAIKGRKKVLVMFSGVAPYAIVIAKQNPKAEVIAIELNRNACKYAEENVKLNKLKNLKIVQADVKKAIKKLKVKFDIILMPRPQLKDMFLKEAFAVSKRGTIVYYYDFAKHDEIESKISAVKKEAARAKKKIKILQVKKAGEIAPYKFRIRVDFRIL